MVIRQQLESSRFLVIQEGIALAVGSAIAKTIFPGFPMIELLSFLAPIILGYAGIKTYQHVKEGASNGNTIPLTPDR